MGKAMVPYSLPPPARRWPRASRSAASAGAVAAGRERRHRRDRGWASIIPRCCACSHMLKRESWSSWDWMRFSKRRTCSVRAERRPRRRRATTSGGKEGPELAAAGRETEAGRRRKPLRLRESVRDVSHPWKTRQSRPPCRRRPRARRGLAMFLARLCKLTKVSKSTRWPRARAQLRCADSLPRLRGCCRTHRRKALRSMKGRGDTPWDRGHVPRPVALSRHARSAARRRTTGLVTAGGLQTCCHKARALRTRRLSAAGEGAGAAAVCARRTRRFQACPRSARSAAADCRFWPWRWRRLPCQVAREGARPLAHLARS